MQRRVREQEGRDEDGDGDGNRHVEAGLESVQTKGEDEGEKTGEERGVRGWANDDERYGSTEKGGQRGRGASQQAVGMGMRSGSGSIPQRTLLSAAWRSAERSQPACVCELNE